jgi:NAD(P)-dependent dehydrogenase (short-subunit alcohol dehydrogenase family)
MAEGATELAGKVALVQTVADEVGGTALEHDVTSWHCASKFAVIGLTQGLAKELAGFDRTGNQRHGRHAPH